MTDAHYDYDIVMMSDLRLPGGTTASMAEEVRAQAAVGYRTALIHVSGPLVRNRNLGVAPHLRRCLAEGLADLVIGQPVRARVAVLRHPSVFEEVPARRPQVRADHVVLVANNTAVNTGGELYYDPPKVTAAVTDLLGRAPTWHPIGPAVRDSLARWHAKITVANTDWLNLIDLDEWRVDRSDGVRGTPTIGRHSRQQPAKWPEKGDDVLAAYPDRDDVRVRVLGGAKPVRDVVGRVPDRWIVEEFGARDPREFLAEVDFFVYFHRSDLIEAYGRTIMEAMASGAVVILPEHFRTSFGDAAIYAQPAEVIDIVGRLTADQVAYVAQSRRGVAFVNATHGYGQHAARLADLVGAAAAGPLASPARAGKPRRARVMFMSSNGAGMGHLTRLLAMARRANPTVEPFFFSLSQAVSVVERYGFRWEYCPSRGDLDLDSRHWNDFFTERFADVIRTYRPQAVVFDGTWPYRGLIAAREQFPDVAYVWSRRAMWREDTITDKLEDSDRFDLVVEPGDVASALDRGPTVGRSEARVVGPITLLDRDDLLDRDEARAALGIEPTAQALLVTLGAGNINDITSDLDVVVDELRRRGGWEIHATKPPIAMGGVDHSDVRPLATYPLARYLNAFDAAVAAAGYNSYHEMLMAGLPTVFVPNLETTTDDQLARARYAEQADVGLCVEAVTPESMSQAFDVLTDAEARSAMRKRALEAYPENGAHRAMGLIEELLVSRGVSA